MKEKKETKRVVSRFNLRINYHEREILNALAEYHDCSMSDVVLNSLRTTFEHFSGYRKEVVNIADFYDVQEEGDKGGQRLTQVEIRVTELDAMIIDLVKKLFDTNTLAPYARYAFLKDYILHRDVLNVEA